MRRESASPSQQLRALSPSFEGPPSSREKLLIPLLACFFLSGFAALLYQVAWFRQFSAVFGTSELAVAAVLAAYMGGLAAGAAIAARFVSRVKRPILVYGLLEGGIALSALAVPVLLTGASLLYIGILGDQPEPPAATTIGQPVFYIALAFLVLALPTAFMGATLPLLTHYVVRTDRELSPKVASLYATNTAGAVTGTLIAAFALLPEVGLRGTVWTGVGINALVFLLAAVLARRVALKNELTTARSSPIAEPTAQPSLVSVNQPAVWILPVMLISGGSSFLYEVLWTRMLTHVIGGSVYAFSTMLAAFLTGIAIGSAIAGGIARSHTRALFCFAGTQGAIALSAIAVYAYMSWLTPESRTGFDVTLYAIGVMLPATIFIGATFPLAVRILAGYPEEASSATARVYAWNTVGAIVGAVLAGFFVIPLLGFEGSIRLAVFTNIGLGLWTLAFAAKTEPKYALAGLVAGLALVALYQPSRPVSVIYRTAFIPENISDPEEIFYGVGRSTTVLLLESNGRYYLRTNGLPEATIEARGRAPDIDAAKWLTALPAIARPNADSLLLIGLGGGVALEGAPPSIRSIDVIELEPEIIAANHEMSGHRDYDPLEDSRVNIVVNDARNALRLTAKTYDLVVSQPSHPWTAGASHLFTREFFADMRAHLNPDGAFVQWINSEYVNEGTLRSLAATLIDSFDYVRLYQPTAQVLVFLASDTSIDAELELEVSGEPLRASPLHFSRLGVNSVEDLIAALALDEEGLRSFADGAPISTDNHNIMAVASRATADGLTLPDLASLFLTHDPLLNSTSWIYGRLGGRLSFDQIARRLIRLGQLSRVSALANVVPDRATRHVIRGMLQQHRQAPLLAQQAYAEALRIDPRNLPARFYFLDAPSLTEAEEFGIDLRALREGLPQPLMAALDGLRLQSSGDWPALASLDDTLARARVTDAWYVQALRLRAEWRLNVRQERQRFANEALQLLDLAMLQAPTLDLGLLRFIGGVTLGDADILLESGRTVTKFVEELLDSAPTESEPLTPRAIAALTRNLRAVSMDLRNVAAAGDRARAEQIALGAEKLIEVDLLIEASRAITQMVATALGSSSGAVNELDFQTLSGMKRQLEGVILELPASTLSDKLRSRAEDTAREAERLIKTIDERLSR